MFERIIVADWSANATPKLGADSIWLAICSDDGAIESRNIATRREAERALTDLLADAAGPSTLLGVDFSIGYPVGTARMLTGRPTADWSSTWRLIESHILDGARNANNRFDVAGTLNSLICSRSATERIRSRSDSDDRITGAGPFWGCPQARVSSSLTATKPSRSAGWPAQWRLTESVMRTQGHRPFDCWQLLGAGSVASQSLVGIPMLERLRARHADRVDVWPFTTGLHPPSVQRGSIVLAEVWPSLHQIDLDAYPVKDQAQVVATTQWLASAELDAAFSPPVDRRHLDAVTTEEGWVLGVDPRCCGGPG